MAVNIPMNKSKSNTCMETTHKTNNLILVIVVLYSQILTHATAVH